MSTAEQKIQRAVETCDLIKELRQSKDEIQKIRDNVFDTINVPFPIVRRAHDHLIDAEKSIDAAAVALTRSK